MTEGYKDFGLHVGFVADTNDPQKQGRVFVYVPGLLEPGAWAEVVMLGSPYARGVTAVPVKDGQVVVGFLQGELESPVVLGGIAPPVIADGARANIKQEDLASFTFYENDDFVFLLGKKETSFPYIAMFSRDTEHRISFIMDLDSLSVKLKAPMSITLETIGVLQLTGGVIKLNDRVVQQNSQPL